MRQVCSVALLCAVVAVFPPAVLTNTTSLVLGQVNIDGRIYSPGTGPIDWSAFDPVTGIGTIAVTVSGNGSHYVAAYLDLTLGSDPDDEFGDYCCAWPDGLSWEVGPPADVHDNFLIGQLNNSVDGGYVPNKDTAMALGWSFDILPGHYATIVFNSGPTPSADFWSLLQANDVFAASGFVYFETKLEAAQRGR